MTAKKCPPHDLSMLMDGQEIRQGHTHTPLSPDSYVLPVSDMSYSFIMAPIAQRAGNYTPEHMRLEAG